MAGILKTLHSVSTYLSKQAVPIQGFDNVPKIDKRVTLSRQCHYHVPNPYKEFRTKSAAKPEEQESYYGGPGDAIYETYVTDPTRTSTNICLQSIEELFSNEEKYRQKLKLFHLYRSHSKDSRINGPLRELQATLEEVEKLHQEIKAEFVDESSFQDIFIERKKRFLIYGPFIMRCMNIHMSLSENTAALTDEEMAAVNQEISKTLPDGIVPLKDLLVLPCQHVLRCYTIHDMFSQLSV